MEEKLLNVNYIRINLLLLVGNYLAYFYSDFVFRKCKKIKLKEQERRLNASVVASGNEGRECKSGKKESSGINFEEELHKIQVKSNIFPVYGDPTTCNLNDLLRNNILSSQYFKDLYALKTYHEVLDEIKTHSKNAEPWTLGTNCIPSTLFCCLYKFMLMRLTG